MTAEPSLEYLGRQMKEMQASMRDVRWRIDLLGHKITQFHETMATNLATVLAAIGERR